MHSASRVFISHAALLLVFVPSPSLAQSQLPLRTTAGSGAGFQHGRRVAVVGDITGDGKAEYMVGEPFDGLPGQPSTTGQGTAILFNGATGAILQQDYGSFTSPQDHLGFGLAGLGDVTGDGVPDFAAGANQGLFVNLQTPRPNGYVRIYSGAALTPPPALPTPIATIGMGFVPPGFNPMSFGEILANVGDVNGDGVDDLAVGAPLATATLPGTTGPGKVFVYSGASLPAGGTLLYVLTGTINDGYFGQAVSGLGDIDNDGAGDIIVGAPQQPASGAGGIHGDGAIHVFSGATGTSLGVVFEGTPGGFQHVGYSVASAGDTDLDGVNDLLVGVPNAWTQLFSQTDGRIYVLSGQQAAQGAAQVLRQINGKAGTGLNNSAQLGFSVAGAGDIDGDGVGDLLAGAPGDGFIDPDGVLPPTAWFGLPQVLGSGTCRLYSGATGDLLKLFWGTEATGVPSPNPGTNAGLGVSVAAGDVTGDGKPDVLAGASGWSNGGAFPNLGKAHLYSGKYTFGNTYGVANPNSFGTTASISASGSLSISANRLVLTVTGLPQGTTVVPFFGSAPNMAGVPVSQGIRYVDGTIKRLPAVQAGPGPGGTASAVIDVNFTSGSGTVIQPMAEWYFQVQYRNTAAGIGVTNMSNAINLGFLP